MFDDKSVARCFNVKATDIATLSTRYFSLKNYSFRRSLPRQAWWNCAARFTELHGYSDAVPDAAGAGGVGDRRRGFKPPKAPMIAATQSVQSQRSLLHERDLPVGSVM